MLFIAILVYIFVTNLFLYTCILGVRATFGTDPNWSLCSVAPLTNIYLQILITSLLEFIVSIITNMVVVTLSQFMYISYLTVS